MPYLTMVCVCPPQTSMMAHGRVDGAGDGRGQLRAPPSRYRDIHPGTSCAMRTVLELSSSSWFICSRNSKTCWASSSSICDSAKPTCTSTYSPDLHLGHMLQTDLLRHAAEIDLAHQHIVLAIGSNDFAGNSKAHVFYAFPIIPRALTGDWLRSPSVRGSVRHHWAARDDAANAENPFETRFRSTRSASSAFMNTPPLSDNARRCPLVRCNLRTRPRQLLQPCVAWKRDAMIAGPTRRTSTSVAMSRIIGRVSS